jgi:hypothetical protein
MGDLLKWITENQETKTMNTIYQAISAIMNEVEAIGKNKRNQAQGFAYRGIDDMYNDLQPKFAKNRVFITSEVLDQSREERINAKGTTLIYTILRVKFTFWTEDGTSVSSIMVGEAMDSGDKGANKAMSIALKYCLMQLLLIPTEELKKEDPDGQVHTASKVPTASEIAMLNKLLSNSTIESGTEAYTNAFNSIKACKDYPTYQKIQHRLESLAKPFDQIANPSQADINKEVKSKTLA